MIIMVRTGQKLTNLGYTNDKPLIARSAKGTSDTHRESIRVKLCSEEYELPLNVKKTKIMICREDADQQILVYKEAVEQVESFNFLGSLVVTTGGS